MNNFKLLKLIILTTVWLIGLFGQALGQSGDLELPLRGAFYYPWYPQTWTVGGEHVFYRPELGYYSSDDAAVAEQHIEDMDYAKIEVAIASWWGIDRQKQSTRIPLLLNKTSEAGSSLKWAFYYESEGFGDPTVEEIKADLDYLMDTYGDHEAVARINGKPVVFVYNADDKSCDVVDKWVAAADTNWYVNLKVFGGFRDCANQPDSWHQYGPSTATQQHSGYSYVISPGFWRADEASPRLARDSARWYYNVRQMVASDQPWQLVTTFNEWGEGTATERCYDWPSQTKFGLYLDALHTDGLEQAVSSKWEDKKAQVVDFYHNPDHETLTVTGEPEYVEIFSISGMLITRRENRSGGSVELSTSGIPPGIYLLRMNLKSGKTRTEKFIK